MDDRLTVSVITISILIAVIVEAYVIWGPF